MKKYKDQVKIVAMYHHLIVIHDTSYDQLTVVNAGVAIFERVCGFFENTYNILNISNKKVQVDLKIVGGKRLPIEEIVNNYSQFWDE